ncbi:GTP-binding protein Di-Ras2-like [Varroa jacobsoni]|uniref:GTP-binding protein Di-Ras2 n=1 Tax=Varroa destructor TaxID=109461 RepID=A0A7M7J7H1_VARDE|nr:GTP-binding protein Di-Ras2-like [Varroa destructor]XP_022704902.1 GTP-binding protein Di-Ras2-like [Varroa jacobsoni]
MPKEASATSGKEADKGAAAAVAGGGKDGTAGAKGSAPPAPAGGGGAVKGTPSKDLAGTGGKDASKNNKDNKDDGKTTSLLKMPEQSNDYRVVVLGAGGVGKSSLVLRFVQGTFRESYIPTVEDTYRQVISCNKNICTLQVTDTTGSHQFPAMQRLNISKGHAFILVFSVTSKQSLEELKPIYNVIREVKSGETEQIPIMLVGNKSDEESCREVDASICESLSKQWQCGYMETSAKNNTNVKELFQALLEMEKRRNMSLQLDGKKTRSRFGRDKLKGKCGLM